MCVVGRRNCRRPKYSLYPCGALRPWQSSYSSRPSLPSMNRSVIGTMRFAVLALFLPTAAFAQRELHWDALQVAAHIDGHGTLQVVETQTMVFTGDWNGGERIFNIRPRQKV